MIRMMTLLGLMMACAGQPALADTEWTTTGPQGGTSLGQFSCNGGSGSGTSCTGTSQYTGPQGRVFTRETARTFTRQGYSATITTTGPNGHTVTTTRQRNR